MRIQMVAIGSTGDVQPMLVLAKALAGRGHAVSLAAFSALGPMVEGAGIAFVPLPGDAERYIGSIIQPGANPFTYISRLEGSLHGMLDQLMDALLAACRGADILVATFFGAVPFALAEHLRIPLVETSYCLTDLTGDHCLPVMPELPLGRWFNRTTYRLAYRMIGTAESLYLGPWYRANGIAQRTIARGPDYRVSGRTVPVLYAMSEHMVPRPPEWGDNIHIVGFWEELADDYTPSEALAAFLAGGDTPLSIGFGSMTSGDMEGALEAVLGALAITGRRAILSSGWGGLEAAALPESVYVLREYVPHPWLFAQTCGVVHHGGAGTTAAGLLAGKPTLVVPFGSDQYFWGNRVHALGCGPKPLPRTKLTAKRLAARLELLLQTPAYGSNAGHMRTLLRAEDGPNTAADLIEAQIR